MILRTSWRWCEKTVIVADASIVMPALVGIGAAGHAARARIRDEKIVAPDILYLEVASVLRKMVRAGPLTATTAETALADLAALPITTIAHRPLLRRIWQLRNNFSSYDAAYVATAESFDAVMLTADERLAAAPGSRCVIEVIR